MIDVFELTRALVDIESITNHEEAVGSYLLDVLSKLAAHTSGRVDRCDVEPGRFNVFAYWGQPKITLSTHMDTTGTSSLRLVSRPASTTYVGCPESRPF